MIHSAVLIQSTRVTDGQTDGISVAYYNDISYHVKFRDFANFSFIYFRAKMPSPKVD